MDPKYNNDPQENLEDFDLEAFLNDPSYDAAGYENPGFDSEDFDEFLYDQDYETVENNGRDPQNPGRGPAPQPENQAYDDGYFNQQEQPEPPRKRRRRGPRITGVIFYVLLLAAIVFFYHQNEKSLADVTADLQVFEAAQPVYICQEIFDDLFAKPDWAALYEQAGIEDTPYEGKDTYAAYMTAKVGENSLSFAQISGEAECLTYSVSLGQEQVGLFTMENHGTAPEAPDWQLGKIELYFTPEQSYRIQICEGQTASVNGVALDDSFLIREDYVETLDKEPIRLPGTRELEIRDLLMQPTVTVADGEGNAVEVSYDEESRTYSVPAGQAAAIGDAEKELALDTVRTYCKYMINKAGGQEGLSKYFKRDTETFKAITGSDLTWIQKEKAYGFANEQVTDYVRYGDDRFSVRVSLTWQLTRPDDSVKESQVEESLIFEKQGEDWKCVRMTGKELTRPVSKVCLTFRNEDQVLESKLVEAGSSSVACPAVSAPEGKTFAGWMTRMTREDGSAYLQRVLVPGEDGTAPIPAGFALEPMVLYPVFEPIA